MNIGERLELKTLRQEVRDLKEHQQQRELLTANLWTCVNDLTRRVVELEAKRGPGRPKKDT